MDCFQLFTGLIARTCVRRANVSEKTGQVILVWFPSSLSVSSIVSGYWNKPDQVCTCLLKVW